MASQVTAAVIAELQRLAHWVRAKPRSEDERDEFARACENRARLLRAQDA
jgi:hypothetical protein